MIEPFIMSFVLAFLSEIVDKTQFVILALALSYKAPFKVFTGALLAHVLLDGIGVAFGFLLASYLMSSIVKAVTGTVFIAIGLWMFARLYFKKEEKEKKTKAKNPLSAAFFTVMLAEFGDKTQITSALLSAKYMKPIPVFIGITLALALAIAINVFVGSKVAEKIPKKAVKIITALLFILFGISTFLF